MASTIDEQATTPRLGFTSLTDEVASTALVVEGQLPAWLTGSLLRTGPAQFEVGSRSMNHWFDGLAMLHRFTVEDGGVQYANRFLETKAYAAARETGEISFAEFATDPCRGLFKRVQTMFSEPNFSDNANVNVMKLGERFVAMTETPIPIEFDADTLHAAKVAPFTVPGHLTTAHPHADLRSGAMLNYAAKLGPRSSYRFFEQPPAPGAAARVIGSLTTDRPAYMHSFGLTERFFVLAEFPFVVNPLKLKFSGRPYIENYEWQPERGTKFTLVDRVSGEVSGGFETEACFAFHHVNAYEEDGEVVVDLCAFEDASIVDALYLDRLRGSGRTHVPIGELTRFRLGLEARTVRRERLVDGGFELPRINYARVNARPYRYAWGTDLGPSGWFEQIVKADVTTGERRAWHEPGHYPGEPVFVARPGAAHEDDGVLLSVVLDARRAGSYLLVLDAADLTELARAQAPHHIPFHFHGQFVR